MGSEARGGTPSLIKYDKSRVSRSHCFAIRSYARCCRRRLFRSFLFLSFISIIYDKERTKGTLFLKKVYFLSNLSVILIKTFLCVLTFIAINIHRLSRWFFRCGHSPALKAARQRAFMVCPLHLFSFSRKRIFKFQFQLLGYLILFQLILNIFLNLLCILSCRVHVVASTPKTSVPIFISCV